MIQDPLLPDEDLAVINVKPRTIRLPKGLKRSIARTAILYLIGEGLAADVDAALDAQGFK
jgi:hypothetical protein